MRKYNSGGRCRFKDNKDYQSQSDNSSQMSLFLDFGFLPFGFVLSLLSL